MSLSPERLGHALEGLLVQVRMTNATKVHLFRSKGEYTTFCKKRYKDFERDESYLTIWEYQEFGIEQLDKYKVCRDCLESDDLVMYVLAGLKE